MSFVRRHRLWIILGSLGLLLVVMALLALPLRSVPGDADAAKAELTKAVEALKTGDADVAFAHVKKARTQVDSVTSTTEGVGAKVWSVVPVAGSAVSDVRALATALDELTSALEVTQKVYPKVSGDDATLMDDGSVDLAVLDEVVAALGRIDTHLTTARTHLDDVKGTAPFVGDQAAAAREEARAQVVPASDGLRRLNPLLDRLPQLLGRDGEKKYVVAMMNPSEMKYSGGSMLTFSVMTLDNGEIKRGKTLDGETSGTFRKRGYWEHVEGNPFVSEYSQRITHANIAPSWPVSGEETLRGWTELRKTEVDGLIALDVKALARMMQVTGPIYVEGLGQVRADNLVALTAGDYDSFTKDEQKTERKALNRALIPAFTDQLFSGVDFVSTMRAVGESAQGRHLALYFRDTDTQQAVADFGLDGDLSQTPNDYVGFFTQNLIGSKADFWQRKDVESTVTLNADGSAKVEMKATVESTAPASWDGVASAYVDPKLDIMLGLFLPQGAEVSKARVSDVEGERQVSTKTGDYFGRPYLEQQALINRGGEKATLSMTYTVPQAAQVKGERLTYRLDLDPHPTVLAARTKVTVIWPDGFSEPSGAGWSRTDKGNWRWTSDATEKRQSLSLSAAKG